jgi:hypothetical protein
VSSLILFISLWHFIHCSFTLLFISFYYDDFELSSSVSLAVSMDENRVDEVSYQEDGSAVDEFTQLQDQYTRILNTTRHLESLSVFSDYGVRIGDLPSSPARSPLHFASLSTIYRRWSHYCGHWTWYFFGIFPLDV